MVGFFAYLIEKKREDNISKALDNRKYLLEKVMLLYSESAKDIWKKSMDDVTHDIDRLTMLEDFSKDLGD